MSSLALYVSPKRSRPDHPHTQVCTGERIFSLALNTRPPAPKSQGEHSYTHFNARSSGLGATQQTDAQARTRAFRGEGWSHIHKNQLGHGVSTEPACCYLPDVQEDLGFFLPLTLTLQSPSETQRRGGSSAALGEPPRLTPWDLPSRRQQTGRAPQRMGRVSLMRCAKLKAAGKQISMLP